MPSLKSLFETPRKAALTIACILVMLVTLGTACTLAVNSFGRSAEGNAPANNPSSAQGEPREEDSPDPSRPGGMVPSKTMEEAREIALADAGLTASGAVFTGEELGLDNGLWMYTFHFQTGPTRYVYEVNANTGAVYAKSVETYVTSSSAPEPSPSSAPEHASAPEPEPAPTSEPEHASSSTPEDAPQPAPSQSSGDGASPEDGAPPDDLNGLPVDSAPIPTAGSIPEMVTGSAYIGVSQAKSIALDHAGLTASQVMVTMATMRRDDGRMVYLIEFSRNGTDYSYKIDAQSGRILAREVDRD